MVSEWQESSSSQQVRQVVDEHNGSAGVMQLTLFLSFFLWLVVCCPELGKRFTSYGLVFVMCVPLWRTWWKGPCGSSLYVGTWRGWFPPPNHGFKVIDMMSCRGCNRKMVCCQLSLDGWKRGRGPPSGDVCSNSPEIRHFWIYWYNLELKDGLLFKRYHKQDGTGTYIHFVVPKSIRDQVLKQMHECILSRHLGRKKLLQRFYWHEVRDDIRLWILRCEVCQTTKLSKRKAKARLGCMTAGAPLDRLSMDILGPLPKTPWGNSYILVVNDSFTKWVEVFALPDEQLLHVLEWLLMKWYVVLVARTLYILTKGETLKVTYSKKYVSCWKFVKQGHLLEIPGAMG